VYFIKKRIRLIKIKKSSFKMIKNYGRVTLPGDETFLLISDSTQRKKKNTNPI